MVWEDKNIVVEEEVESSDDEESDLPDDDFDMEAGEGGVEGEEKSGSEEDGDDDEESDESEVVGADINAPVVIGEGAEDESDESEEEEEDGDDDESDESEGGDDINTPVVIGEGAEVESDDSEEEDTIENNDSDAESKDNNDEHETDDEDAEDEGNVGWADAMSKVLAMGTNSDKIVSVLSKAKKDNVKKKTVKTGDNAGSDGEENDEVEKKYEPLALRKARKKEVDSIGRKIPDVLDRNAEKVLAKIATRGVVQLFNAVREQQKDLKSKLKEAGGSFRRQEKVFKNIDKNSFVEILTGKSISKPLGEPLAKKPKTEVKDENDENQSTWNILRDDFMLGAKMRDWDKESDGE